jgi:sulfite reductase alpha subunit-like flavoprotein
MILKQNLDSVRIYVAGRAKVMPQGVERSLIGCIRTWAKEEDRAEEIYQEMKNKKQIVFETWD